VLRRIALLVTPGPLRVSDLDSQRELTLDTPAFVLTLEHEPTETFVRGHLKPLHDGTPFPIQTNLALFELLQSLLDRAAGTP
jgi:hypothetical protein